MQDPTSHFDIDPAILLRPDSMSTLGKRLVNLSRDIQEAGTAPLSLEEIHRNLAIQNGEEDHYQALS